MSSGFEVGGVVVLDVAVAHVRELHEPGRVALEHEAAQPVVDAVAHLLHELLAVGAVEVAHALGEIEDEVVAEIDLLGPELGARLIGGGLRLVGLSLGLGRRRRLGAPPTRFFRGAALRAEHEARRP